MRWGTRQGAEDEHEKSVLDYVIVSRGADINRGAGLLVNAERLAMLTCRTVEFGGGRGGIPEITPLDVAAAMGMAKLSQLESAILLVKWADHGKPGHIWSATLLEVERTHRDWIGPGIVQHVIRAAVGRLLGYDRCETCEATGSDWSTGLPVDCAHCAGYGVLPDDHRFAAPWQARYRLILAMLEVTEDEALRKVRV